MENIFGSTASYIVIFVLALALVVVIVRKRKIIPFSYMRRKKIMDEIEEEIDEIDYASKSIASELQDIKELEKDIQEKIKKLD